MPSADMGKRQSETLTLPSKLALKVKALLGPVARRPPAGPPPRACQGMRRWPAAPGRPPTRPRVMTTTGGRRRSVGGPVPGGRGRGRPPRGAARQPGACIAAATSLRASGVQTPGWTPTCSAWPDAKRSRRRPAQLHRTTSWNMLHRKRPLNAQKPGALARIERELTVLREPGAARRGRATAVVAATTSGGGGRGPGPRGPVRARGGEACRGAARRRGHAEPLMTCEPVRLSCANRGRALAELELTRDQRVAPEPALHALLAELANTGRRRRIRRRRPLVIRLQAREAARTAREQRTEASGPRRAPANRPECGRGHREGPARRQGRYRGWRCPRRDGSTTVRDVPAERQIRRTSGGWCRRLRELAQGRGGRGQRGDDKTSERAAPRLRQPRWCRLVRGPAITMREPARDQKGRGRVMVTAVTEDELRHAVRAHPPARPGRTVCGNGRPAADPGPVSNT